MFQQRKNYRNNRTLWAAISGIALMAAPALAGTTVGPDGLMDTISISGSTALKNFITGAGVTELTPGTPANPGSFTTTVGGVVTTYPPAGDPFFDSGGNLLINGVNGFQLAPKTLPASDTTTGANQVVSALRVEYHESGSVEGILELANDQIKPVNYVENNIDRNPNNGNAVWVNGNQIGGSSTGGPGTTKGGYYLGPAYGVNPDGSVKSFGPRVSPTFSLGGQNTSSVAGSIYTQAGQNAVQLAISDVVPVQAFQNDYGANGTQATHPWLSTPQNLGYGQGNTTLSTGGLGVAGGGVILQSPSNLNMNAADINPRTGGTFGAGPGIAPVWPT